MGSRTCLPPTVAARPECCASEGHADLELSTADIEPARRAPSPPHDPGPADRDRSAAAFVGGVVLGAGAGEHEAAQRFTEAWDAALRGDVRRAHPRGPAEYPFEEFEQAYSDGQATATAVRVSPRRGRARPRTVADAAAASASTPRLRPARRRVELPAGRGAVDWAPHLVFPGLTPGETLGPPTRRPSARHTGPRRYPALGGAGLGATLAARGRRARVAGSVGSPRGAGARALRARLSRGQPRRHQRTRACLQPTPRGPAERSADRGRAARRTLERGHGSSPAATPSPARR